jgi:hypothetical protein
VAVRRDGVAILDVRTTIETNDGALIYVAYSGTSDRGEDGYQLARRVAGKRFAAIYFPTFPKFPPRLRIARSPALPWSRPGTPGAGRGHLRYMRDSMSDVPTGTSRATNGLQLREEALDRVALAVEALAEAGFQRRLLLGGMLGVAPWSWISSRMRSAS